VSRETGGRRVTAPVSDLPPEIPTVTIRIVCIAVHPYTVRAWKAPRVNDDCEDDSQINSAHPNLGSEENSAL
jgi:hypothetical protein